MTNDSKTAEGKDRLAENNGSAGRYGGHRTTLKAQTLVPGAEAEYLDRMLNDRGPIWADRLAASIVKHAV